MPHSFEDIMGAITALILVAVFFFLLIRAYWIWHTNQSRRQSMSSNKKPTLFDVRELLLRGEKEQAVKVYRQVFKVDQKQAQAAVTDLERNLHNPG